MEYLKLFPNLKKIYLTKMLCSDKILFGGHKTYIKFIFSNFEIIENFKMIRSGMLFDLEEIKLSKEDEEKRNKQIDILKQYIQINLPHIEII
jgi:TM2 domain-containing membrane protein YozV